MRTGNPGAAGITEELSEHYVVEKIMAFQSLGLADPHASTALY